MAERTRILLVDDEKAFRDTSKRLLTGRGFDVFTAENGKIGLEMLKENPVDLILLDLRMPEMGGEEFLSVMMPLYPEVPVIVLSGHGTLDSAVACMKRGAYDFITKPFDVEETLLCIERALEKRRLEEKAKQYQEETVRNLLDLNTEKKRLETIIDCMANGLMVTDTNMNVILHNPALLHLLGIADHLMPPFPLTRIIKEGALVETIKDILKGETPHKAPVSQEIQMGDATLRAISAPALGLDRHVFWAVVGAVTVLEDITLFKRLDKMKSDFVNMVAHELRTPLVSIRQLNSVLLEGMAGPLQDKQMDFVKRGVNKIDLLLALINDLLDVAKLEQGRLAQRKVPTDLGKIIEETVAFMEPRARHLGVMLSCSCENLSPVYADPKNMEEIFNNLVSNAINYSPGGGRVRVSAKGMGDFVEIRVSDTGVGIPPEELPKIFEKFYRVKHPKTRHVTGTGLGLSIVKGVVEELGGTIEVESVVDKGSTFRILLPATREENGSREARVS